MAEICPLYCGTCTHSCNDTDASCGSWAMQGECEANPDAMLRLCPTSCGLCTPECKDLKEECPGWGAAGECNENPEFMIRNCPVTCEACKSTCKDMQSDCPGWVADGECYKVRAPPMRARTCPRPAARWSPPARLLTPTFVSSQNPGFMYKECPSSCGVCENMKCSDNNSTQCAIWAEAGECLNNPLAVMKECPDACGVRRARTAPPPCPTAACPPAPSPLRLASPLPWYGLASCLLPLASRTLHPAS